MSHSVEFGKLNKVDLREVWPNEAFHFTPWLESNIEALGEALGFELEILQREAAVSGFSLDLLARDLGRDRVVVIENQLESTDHTHLGQLITYAAGFDAGVVIWITGSVREEHRQALDWLNQHTSEDLEFYAVVVEVLQIDGSRPAFYFKPVAFPNNWRKSKIRSSSADKTHSERALRYQAFFQDLIDTLREEHRFTNARKGQPQNWYSFASGFSGVQYGLNFTRDHVRVEVYIDLKDADKNQHLFDSRRQELETAYGHPLSWEPLEERRACRIAEYRPGSIEDDTGTLELLKNWGIERLLKLREIFESSLRTFCERM